jgi:HK97 gp10 family phage protein
LAKENVRIEGLAELEYNLSTLGVEMRKRGTRRMMAQAAIPMRDEAKRRAPVLREPDPRRRAGTLRDRIRIWLHRDSPYPVTYYVGVRGLSRGSIRKFKAANKGAKGSDNPDDPYYWRWVELGTSKMRAQPFLRPAYEATKMESARRALEAGRDFVRRIRLKRLRRIIRASR